MAGLRDLYQEVILEHSKVPRNYREMAEADHKAEGFNPFFLLFHVLVRINVHDGAFKVFSFIRFDDSGLLPFALGGSGSFAFAFRYSLGYRRRSYWSLPFRSNFFGCCYRCYVVVVQQHGVHRRSIHPLCLLFLLFLFQPLLLL